MSFYGSRLSGNSDRPLSSQEVSLDVRQHPMYALLTAENKEKMRKPVDPPPIVELKVHSDKQNWLVNPFLFMNAVLVECDNDQRNYPKPSQGSQLIGQNVSSLHRLKDINNRDGGFFVFGDISCRKLGFFRLQFNLFNYEKDEVNFLSSAVSKPFRVMSQKDYPGLQESTHLSRAFSDQGVRLRLRKEQRGGGTKRAYASTLSHMPDNHQRNAYHNGPVQDYGHQEQERTTIKRQRSDSEYSPSQMYAGPSHPNSNAWPPHQYGATQSMIPSMSPHAHAVPSAIPSWQRSQGQYNGPMGGNMSMNGGPYGTTGMVSGQAVRSSDYGQQGGQQYTRRSMNDSAYGSGGIPQLSSDPSVSSAPSSLTSMGMQGQGGNYSHGLLPSRQSTQQQFEVPRTVNDWAQAAYTQPIQQSYQQPTTTATSIEQSMVNDGIKSEQEVTGYGEAINNFLSNSPPSAFDQIANQGTALGNALLSREYSHPYPSQEQTGVGFDLDGHGPTYVQRDHSTVLPTPYQTSPA